MSFFASSLPVPHVLGFPVGLWALFCLGRISGSLRNGVLPLGRGSYLLRFLRSFSFLVMPIPFWFLCVGRFLLLSFSSSLPPVLFPSSCGSFLLGGPSSSSSVGFFRLRFRSRYLLRPVVFSLGLFSLVCLLLSSRFHFLLVVPPCCCFGRLPFLRFPSSSCLGWVHFLCVCSP